MRSIFSATQSGCRRLFTGLALLLLTPVGALAASADIALLDASAVTSQAEQTPWSLERTAQRSGNTVNWTITTTPAAPQVTRPVSTYSIVARDPETGQMGVAVQSHWFCVGCIVSWAEAGVGAVATQSFVDPAYGPLGLKMMRVGKSAPDALRGLIKADHGRDVRQVAFLDVQGRVSAYTGAKAIHAAGHQVGESFAVQANLMERDTVWPAMARAFEAAEGDLAERMLAALEAAEAEGGDIRGRQSAAIVVVAGKSTGKPWEDRIFDLRVDDHPEPLKELRRLVRIARAYNHMYAADKALEEKDFELAMRESNRAMELNPENAEMVYWTAVKLASIGRVEESLPLFRKTFAAGERWRTLTPRLPRSGLLPDDAELMRRILAEGREP